MLLMLKRFLSNASKAHMLKVVFFEIQNRLQMAIDLKWPFPMFMAFVLELPCHLTQSDQNPSPGVIIYVILEKLK